MTAAAPAPPAPPRAALPPAPTPEPSAGGAHTLDPERLPDHLDRLYRAALALCRSPQDAEDLVQDTYARVLARPRLVRRDDDVAYLLRVLHNTFAGRWRSARRAPVTETLRSEIEIQANPGDEPKARASASAVLDLARDLPPNYRDAVIAVDIVGLTYKQAARALRTREGTVMSRLHRGRRRLAEALEPAI